jgi:hypothetical protein
MQNRWTGWITWNAHVSIEKAHRVGEYLSVIIIRLTPRTLAVPPHPEGTHARLDLKRAEAIRVAAAAGRPSRTQRQRQPLLRCISHIGGARFLHSPVPSWPPTLRQLRPVLTCKVGTRCLFWTAPSTCSGVILNLYLVCVQEIVVCV